MSHLSEEITEQQNRIAELEQYVIELQVEARKVRFSYQLTQALYDISNAVMISEDLTDLYKSIYTVLNNLRRLPNFYIALASEQQNSLNVPFWIDQMDEKEFENTIIDLKNSLTGEVLMQKKAVFLDENELSKRGQDGRILGTTPKVWLGVPLYVNKKVTGVMAVQHYFDASYFDEYDLNFMVSVSNQVALAIERKRNLEEIRQLRNHLANVINSMPSVLIGVDSKGNINQWNKTAIEMTGLEYEMARKESLARIFPELKPLATKVSNTIQTGQVNRLLNQQIKNADEQQYWDITIFPLTDKSPTGAVIRIDDVTEKRILEEQLNQRSKMDAIGELSSGIAHDFNNMLGSIISATELLEHTIPQDIDTQKCLKIILNCAEQASGLTESLLTFSQNQDRDFSVVDLHSILTDTISLLKSTVDKRIKIKSKLNAKESLIHGVQSQLQSAILNLSINAIHAMPEGGQLKIKSKNIILDQAKCQNFDFEIDAGNYLKIQIQDSGTGISADILSRVFEPFFTTKRQQGGTGLGLSIVHGTIVSHGGAITLTSEIDSGTLVEMYLPLATIEQKITPETDVAIRGTGRILIIDDEPTVLYTAQKTLESLGYEVDVTEDCKSGIEYYANNASEIDLIILDMMMPGMSGLDCFKEIKKANPQAKVILSSGYSKEEDITLMKQQGLSGFLAKPYRTATLSKMIHKVLRL